jgi:hypothetical protein
VGRVLLWKRNVDSAKNPTLLLTLSRSTAVMLALRKPAKNSWLLKRQLQKALNFFFQQENRLYRGGFV